MRITCPRCATAPPADQINMATDLAFCPACGEAFAISARLAEGTRSVRPATEMPTPPPGAWIREEPGATVVGATTRSPIAFFLVPFMTVWSGFSLGGIYG